MTVSNHRPFTYPAGRVAPPHAGATPSLADRTLSKYVEQTREGGVRYSDFAIGKFIEQARSKPWFKDTLFVVLADRRLVGRQDRGHLGAYHIPALFYAPDFLAPRRIDRLGSVRSTSRQHLGALRRAIAEPLRRSGSDFRGGTRTCLHFQLPEGSSGARRQCCVAWTAARRERFSQRSRRRPDSDRREARDRRRRVLSARLKLARAFQRHELDHAGRTGRLIIVWRGSSAWRKIEFFEYRHSRRSAGRK